MKLEEKEMGLKYKSRGDIRLDEANKTNEDISSQEESYAEYK